jgi:hypothetical protein
MAARLTDHERRLRAVTEADWQTRVLQVLRWHGWIALHQSTSMRLITVRGQQRLVGDKESKGLLDTFAVHPEHGWILLLELKTHRPSSKVTAEQAAVIDALLVSDADSEPCAHRVAVLRPGDRELLERLAEAPWDVDQAELPVR